MLHKPRRPGWLTARPYAHRGLHGAGRVENSLGAFAAAIEEGLGIELDVRSSRCGAAIVFHDPDLDRLCEAAGPIAGYDRRQLGAIRFRASGETVPALSEALALIAGRVPLLVEIKSSGADNMRLCAAVRADLGVYASPAAIMSFDPRILLWFRLRAPRLLRGLVVSEAAKKFGGLAERHLALRLGRPDFLAYDIASLPSRFAARARGRGHAVLSWTVRTPAEAARAAVHADQIIFESGAGR